MSLKKSVNMYSFFENSVDKQLNLAIKFIIIFCHLIEHKIKYKNITSKIST